MARAASDDIALAVASALSLASVNPDTLMELARELGLRAGLHRIGSLATVLQMEKLAVCLRPLTASGRVVSLDPDYPSSVTAGA